MGRARGLAAKRQWLDDDLADVTSRTYTVDEDTLGHHHRPSFEPPLRCRAAGRGAAPDAARLDNLLCAAEAFEPRHRDALIHGLLDARSSPRALHLRSGAR